MRLLAAKLAVAALASLAAATTPKSGKPTILRVKKSDGAVKRVAFDGAATLDELHERAHADELFSDDACTRACTADDLVHGAVVYERPMEKEDEPEEAAAEAFFSPYPELQKKSSLRAKRRQKNLRANTWKELLREREGVFYVKSFERVCDMCRLSQDCVEELSGRGAHAAWLIGRRGVRKENATTFAESAYVVGARDDDVFEIAQLCGLEVVGVAVVRPDSDGDDKSILLTPYEVALVSELQVEAMRRCETLKRPFSFPTLIIAPRSSGGLATEAFEASELTVQMAAERVLEQAVRVERGRHVAFQRVAHYADALEDGLHEGHHLRHARRAKFLHVALLFGHALLSERRVEEEGLPADLERQRRRRLRDRRLEATLADVAPGSYGVGDDFDEDFARGHRTKIAAGRSHLCLVFTGATSCLRS